MWTTTRLTARAEILEFLETDRLYAAYAIGDLEPGLFEQCEWFGARARESTALGAIVLRFSGLVPPALFLMGDVLGLEAILAGQRRLAEEGEVSLSCRREHLRVAQRFFGIGATEAMWRMVLRRERFRPADGRCVRLGPEDMSRLVELFSVGGGDAFHPRQLDEGVFYGVEAKGRLVSVAGTHLVSRTYGVAAVGNVYTDPAWRGQGLGAATTSAVTADLVGTGIRDIVLNVSKANAAAVRVYERVGFERHCPFAEAGRALPIH